MSFFVTIRIKEVHGDFLSLRKVNPIEIFHEKFLALFQHYPPGAHI